MLITIVTYSHLGMTAESITIYQESATAAKNLAAYPAVVFPSESVKRFTTTETFFRTLVLHPIFL